MFTNYLTQLQAVFNRYALSKLKYYLFLPFSSSLTEKTFLAQKQLFQNIVFPPQGIIFRLLVGKVNQQRFHLMKAFLFRFLPVLS